MSMHTVASPTNDATPTLSGSKGLATGDDPSVAVTVHEGGSVSGIVVASVKR